MLTRTRQLFLPFTLGALLWSVTLMTGGDYLHAQAHHHEEHEADGQQECAWDCLLHESILGTDAGWSTVPADTFIPESPFISEPFYTAPLADAPPRAPPANV